VEIASLRTKSNTKLLFARNERSFWLCLLAFHTQLCLLVSYSR